MKQTHCLCRVACVAATCIAVARQASPSRLAPAMAVAGTHVLNAFMEKITAAAHDWCSQWCFAVGAAQPGSREELAWAVIPEHNPVGLGIMRACARFASELAIEDPRGTDLLLKVTLVRVALAWKQGCRCRSAPVLVTYEIRSLQDAGNHAASAPDAVSGVLAVTSAIERHIGSRCKCPGFEFCRGLVAHLAASVPLEYVGTASSMRTHNAALKPSTWRHCRTLRRCLACSACWDWNTWRGCRRCMSHCDYGQAADDAEPAAGAMPRSGKVVAMTTPEATPLIAGAGGVTQVTRAVVQGEVLGNVNGSIPVPPLYTAAIDALYEQASKYPELAEHGPTVSDYDAFCNQALKHGVVRVTLWLLARVPCGCSMAWPGHVLAAPAPHTRVLVCRADLRPCSVSANRCRCCKCGVQTAGTQQLRL